MNKKAALLEALLKAQKNGTLKDRALVTKIEMQLNATERVVKARYPRKCDNPPCKTTLVSAYGPGKSVGGGPKGEGEYCSAKCAEAHENALGLKPEDLPFKRSEEEEDPLATYQKGADEHVESAKHMGGHKLVQHTSHTMEDHHDRDDLVEHVLHAAEKGHKIHVTFHPASDTYHVSSWKPKRGK